MAAAADAGQSGESYIGSFISLVSKAEIRYEGFLYHLNPQQSTIGLRNVKSFGTEGRRTDGPQVLPSDKVYEYIFFRGSDIKDLQVLSSPAARSTPALPNDPAIIQPHYPISTPASSSFPAVNAFPQINTGGTPQSGIPSSNYGSNWPQNQPAGSSGSWGSFLPPPIANGYGVTLPTYWPGLNGSLLGASHLHCQSLLGTPQSLQVSPPAQQMTPNSSMNASPVDASKFAESSFNSSPTLGLQSPSLTSAKVPQSALSAGVSSSDSAMVHVLSPNLTPNNTSHSLPADTFVLNSLLLPPLVASSLDTSPVLPPVVDKPKPVLNPPLSNPSVSEPLQYINGSSGPVESQTTVSLVTPGQLLQAGPAERSLPYLQTSNEYVDADRLSKPKPLPSDTVHAVDTALALPSFPVKKGTAQPNNPNVRVHARGKRNSFHGAASMNHHSYRGRPRTREHEPNRAALQSNQTIKGHHRGRKIGPNTADGRTHSNVRGHGRGLRAQPNTRDESTHYNANTAGGPTHYNVRGRGNGNGLQPNTRDGRTHYNANTAHGPTYYNVRGRGKGKGPQPNVRDGRPHYNANTASEHTHCNFRGREKGKGPQAPFAVTTFANDFDFEAMNEKFNKEEIWGDLGKRKQTRFDEFQENGINFDADDTGGENKDELPRSDRKPVYVKDEFFDSLSCQPLGYKSGRERTKLSERRKIDVETFGEIPKHRRGHTSREPGWGGQSRESRRRRGYGYVVRGRGEDDVRSRYGV